MVTTLQWQIKQITIGSNDTASNLFPALNDVSPYASATSGMGCRRLREKYLTFNFQPFCMTVPLKKHIVYDFIVIQLSMCRYWNAKLNVYV